MSIPPPSPDLRLHRTERLRLDAPGPEDLEPLHEIYADPRVWTHYPSQRFTDPAQTAAMLDRFQGSWQRAGLGPWIVRRHDADPADPSTVLGNGGCDLRGQEPDGLFWNLGYRLTPAVQGLGLAGELARAAVDAARALRPELPVIAYLLEENRASRRVAEKTGLCLRHRAPDAGNPDPQAVRLVLADRELTPAQLASALH
ncbi:GCN5 family acetyltransferase [Brachybacterium phenoliresistens]|uniref:GCN5 family acetyltransferase n=1 Tax=Brachybacterium phenoliresistens TaxID=396014 RepID=Z9JQ21_9MICO|nr:GNAT family N-acetyltransferase [Brachybacterium phenoliresistens]EWS79857.1 GCN5 family acetyltransferase [Brachybacterium phenoliresistens]